MISIFLFDQQKLKLWHLNLTAVKFLCEKGALLHTTRSLFTAVENALYARNFDFFRYIYDLYYTQTGRHLVGECRRTFLIRAVQKNKLSLVKYLWEIEDIEYRDLNGGSALITACRKGNLEMIKFLCKRCDPNNYPGSNLCSIVEPYIKHSPLHLAAINDDSECIQCIAFLLDNDYPDINILAHKPKDWGQSYPFTKYKWFTPLTMAIVRNNVEMAKFLIKRGASVNVTKNDECPPLNIGMYDETLID